MYDCNCYKIFEIKNPLRLKVNSKFISMLFPHHHESVSGAAADSPLSFQLVIVIVLVASLLGIIWAIINYLSIKSIDMDPKHRITGVS